MDLSLLLCYGLTWNLSSSRGQLQMMITVVVLGRRKEEEGKHDEKDGVRFFGSMLPTSM